MFDLPEVIEHVTCFQPEGGQTERISYVPGERLLAFAVSQCLPALRVSAKERPCLCACVSVCVFSAWVCVCLCVFVYVHICV